MTDNERVKELEDELRRMKRKYKDDVERLTRQLYAQEPYRDPADDYRDDERYRPGCGQDDTRDSKGRKLRLKYNEAGEPYWM